MMRLVLSPSIVMHGRPVKVERFAFHHSQLFDRGYLVAFVSRDAFRAANPDSDASAGEMTNPKLPPIVIMPEKSRHRGASALSTIEHEIVHINQIGYRCVSDRYGDSNPVP